MIDSEFFTLMVVVFALWLLTDDVRRGLKDSSIKLPVNVSEPSLRRTIKTTTQIKLPVPVFTQSRSAYVRDEQASISAGKALGMR